MNESFSLLSQKLPSFEVREGQLKMFEDVQNAYQNETTHLIEAGTGIGKSLAYLVPALLWAIEHGERTVIATHTIALQEQLMQKDIPLLLEALDLEAHAVLVKGMHNYVCLRKLKDAQNTLPDSILKFAATTKEGSKTELPVYPSSDLWEQVGAESENCTYQKCPHYKECFYFKARKNAAEAQIVVANHALLCADLAIREKTDDFNQDAILPVYRRLIIDEAHHIEDVATQYFAGKVSRYSLVHQLGRLFSDRGTGKLVTLYRKVCEAYPNGNILTEPLTISLPVDKRDLVNLVNHTFEVLGDFLAALKSSDEKVRLRQHHLEHLFWKEQVQPAVKQLFDSGKSFVSQLLLLEGQLKQVNDSHLVNKCESVLAEIGGICDTLLALFETLHQFVFLEIDPSRVRWIEGNAPDLHLIQADLDIAKRLSKTLFEKVPTIVLCSATLSTHQNFAFTRKRLGIEEANESIYPSPFDLNVQSMLNIPTDLPEPADPNFTKQAAKRIWEIIRISDGGAFVLFTSYSMLKACEEMLKHQLYKHNYLLYCQKDESRSALLRKFRSSEKAVLFGTDSFWEGVDVVGEALRCVIIVKLPFKVPNDPLFQARSEAIEQKGGSAFFEYSLPHAIVKFKQGFGRLIRTKEDRGCVICLDTRLVKKGYGKLIVKSLPKCPVISGPSQDVYAHMSNFYNNPQKPR